MSVIKCHFHSVFKFPSLWGFLGDIVNSTLTYSAFKSSTKHHIPYIAFRILTYIVYISKTSLVVQWLRPCISNSENVLLIPGWETKFPHAAWCGQNCTPPSFLIFPAKSVINLPAIQETQVQPLSRDVPLEKGIATYSSILGWKIPWKKEPSRLQSMGSQRVGHNWVTFTHLQTLNTFLSSEGTLTQMYFKHIINFKRNILNKMKQSFLYILQLIP